MAFTYLQRCSFEGVDKTPFLLRSVDALLAPYRSISGKKVVLLSPGCNAHGVLISPSSTLFVQQRRPEGLLGVAYHIYALALKGFSFLLWHIGYEVPALCLRSLFVLCKTLPSVMEILGEASDQKDRGEELLDQGKLALFYHTLLDHSEDDPICAKSWGDLQTNSPRRQDQTERQWLMERIVSDLLTRGVYEAPQTLGLRSLHEEQEDRKSQQEDVLLHYFLHEITNLSFVENFFSYATSLFPTLSPSSDPSGRARPFDRLLDKPGDVADASIMTSPNSSVEIGEEDSPLLSPLFLELLKRKKEALKKGSNWSHSGIEDDSRSVDGVGRSPRKRNTWRKEQRKNTSSLVEWTVQALYTLHGTYPPTEENRSRQSPLLQEGGGGSPFAQPALFSVSPQKLKEEANQSLQREREYTHFLQGLLSFFTSQELEALVCRMREIPPSVQNGTMLFFYREISDKLSMARARRSSMIRALRETSV